jgi:hypothetical protein
LREQNPDCKVILLSGSPYWKSRRKSQVEEFDGFVLLPKPFSPNQLLSLIKAV